MISWWLGICRWLVVNFNIHLCSSGVDSDLGECFFRGLCKLVIINWPPTQVMSSFLKMRAMVSGMCGLVWKQFQCHPKGRVRLSREASGASWSRASCWFWLALYIVSANHSHLLVLSFVCFVIGCSSDSNNQCRETFRKKLKKENNTIKLLWKVLTLAFFACLRTLIEKNIYSPWHDKDFQLCLWWYLKEQSCSRCVTTLNEMMSYGRTPWGYFSPLWS